MLKAAGAFLVIFACGAFGYGKSAVYRKRLWQLEEIQKMVFLLLGEITYRREALPEAMCRVAGKCREPLAGFLEEVSRQAKRYEGGRLSEIFAEKTEEFFKESGLNRQDRESFAQLGEYLGYLDIGVQKNTAELYLKELEQEIARAREEEPARTKLYGSLGILGGMFAVIVFL